MAKCSYRITYSKIHLPLSPLTKPTPLFDSRENPFPDKQKTMESQQLTALLSSLLSQLLLLLILIFPDSSNPHFLLSNSHEINVFPLITHFLFSQDILSSLSFLSLSRKRKRTHLLENQLRVPNFLLTRNLDSFTSFFRMTSSTFEWLSGLLEPLLECRDPVSSPLNLPAEIRLGVGLSRLATGSDFGTISVRFGVSESVARFCVKQLCRVLCTNFRFWVEFPTPIELDSTSSAFEGLAGLPNCCGVISCTRFKVMKNNNSNEDSIATQLVVDSSSRILSIVAGFRGDKDDKTVLMSSTLFKDIEGGKLLDSTVNQYLMGNGEYPLLPWLMVPFDGPAPGSIEESFNEAHRLMSIPALRAIVSLRNWGVLRQPIHEEFKTAVAYIGACSILHNALLMREDFSAMANESESLSLHDHSSQNIRDFGSNETASDARRVLAMRAKELHS